MFRVRGRRRGFTAVEVLAVTTILTSLGGGSFIGVTEQAHRTACEQHLRQIGMALQMRAMTDEPLPRAWFYPPDPPHPARETYNIVRLMASEVPASMFICPSAPTAIQQRGICYVYNDACGGKLLDQIPNPSMTWLMMDINVVSSQVPPRPQRRLQCTLRRRARQVVPGKPTAEVRPAADGRGVGSGLTPAPEPRAPGRRARSATAVHPAGGGAGRSATGRR